jgi:hypothetical protein
MYFVELVSWILSNEVKFKFRTKFMRNKKQIDSCEKKVSSWAQFHQHFTRGFFVRKFRTKLFLYLDLRFVLFWCKNIGAKAAHNMLVKLTPGLNFTNVSRSAFTPTVLHQLSTNLKC